MLKREESLILIARDEDEGAATDRVVKKLKIVSGEKKDFDGEFQVIVADISQSGLGIKQNDLALFQDVSAIWHCAALSQFNGKFQSAIRQTNVEGTRNVLEFARKIGAERFHYVSSAYVCGNRQGTVFENELNAGQTFKNTYEESKFEAEKLVKESGLQTTIYRPSIVVGSSKNGITTNFTGFNYLAKSFYRLKERLLHLLKKEPNEFGGSGIVQTESGLFLPIRIPCSENGTVNLVCVDYVVETMLMLAEKSDSVGKVFHVTNQTPPKGRDLFTMSGNILGITDLSFANNREEVLSNPQKNEMLRKYEELFIKEIDPYINYLSSEPFFDNSNVREILGVEYKPHEMINENLLKMLLDYGIARNWHSE